MVLTKTAAWRRTPSETSPAAPYFHIPKFQPLKSCINTHLILLFWFLMCVRSPPDACEGHLICVFSWAAGDPDENQRKEYTKTLCGTYLDPQIF